VRTESFPVALVPGLDANHAVAAEFGRLGGVVGDGVLGANVVGHLFGDGIDIFYRFGEIGCAAGLFGEGFEYAAGVARLGFVGVVAEEQADAVDDGTVEVLNAANGLLEGGAGGVVFAVGDDQQDLLGCLAFLER